MLACCLLICRQVAVRRGSAKKWDHAQLVHAQWYHITRIRAAVFVKRVGTHDNIADLPSRQVQCVFVALYTVLVAFIVEAGLPVVARHGGA